MKLVLPQKSADLSTVANRQPSRVGKRLLSGHFEQETVFALHELLAREGRARGQRITVQAAIARGLELFFQDRGATPPSELIQKGVGSIPTIVTGTSRHSAHRVRG